MRSVILHCPALGRDISSLLVTVPGTVVHEGLHTPRAYLGSTSGHKAIVAEARMLGADSVWVMEDDCEFVRGFTLERWLNHAEWAKSHNYDVFVGGSTRTYDEKIVQRFEDGSAMIEVSAFHSSHCVVYFKSCFEKMEMCQDPADLSMGRDCGARCVVAWPFFAVQRPSFSGCEGHPVNYVPLYEQHEQYLGAFVNGLIL